MKIAAKLSKIPIIFIFELLIASKLFFVFLSSPTHQYLRLLMAQGNNNQGRHKPIDCFYIFAFMFVKSTDFVLMSMSMYGTVFAYTNARISNIFDFHFIDDEKKIDWLADWLAGWLFIRLESYFKAYIFLLCIHSRVLCHKN